MPKANTKITEPKKNLQDQCLVAVRLPRHLLESLDSYVAAVDSDRSKIIRAALRQRIGANTTAA